MKIRESGMPEQDYWESLFDADKFIAELGFSSGLHDVAEFGCGYGSFTIPIAKRISGHVFAMDLDPEMLKATYQNALSHDVDNITILQCDFVSDGAQLSSESVDGALIAHLLHGSEKDNLELLQEAFRILKPGGLLALIHWRSDVDTPRGPPLEFRLTAKQAKELAQAAGFNGESIQLDLGQFHWGLKIHK